LAHAVHGLAHIGLGLVPLIQGPLPIYLSLLANPTAQFPPRHRRKEQSHDGPNQDPDGKTYQG
jgi:hypothetical protein